MAPGGSIRKPTSFVLSSTPQFWVKKGNQMATSNEKRAWHAVSTGNHQGLVIDSNTGRNVAVTYKAEDATIVAAAPRMFDVLETIAMGNTDPDVMVAMAKEVLRDIEVAA
jgi:hypothetical protein